MMGFDGQHFYSNDHPNAYIKILVLACVYPVVLIITTYLQYVVYCWYNRSQHPFKILVENFKGDENEMEMNSLNGNEQEP